MIGEIAQLVLSVATLIGIMVSSYISLRNYSKLTAVDDRVKVVETHTDGLLTAAKEATIAAKSDAEGASRGHREAAENAAANPTPPIPQE